MHDNAPASPSHETHAHDAAPIAAGVTAGFATAAAMWTIGYLLHLPGLSTPSAIVGICLLLTQIAGALLAGMKGPSDSWMNVGLASGVTVGLLNLLVLGSMLFEPTGETTTAQPNAAVIVLGWIVYSAVVGVLGAKVGGVLRPAPRSKNQTAVAWVARFAVVASLTMLPLLLVGGVVTTSDSGMAVPDWPNTFGSNMFLFPLSRMTGGVYFEHTHRLFGALVGLTTLALLVMTLSKGPSGKAKTLAVLVFVLVTAQGILGGIRVTESSRALAMLHGVSAQGIFALLVALTAVCSLRWNDGHAPSPAPRYRKLVRFAWVTLVMVLIQIALGGMIRHFSTDGLSMHSVYTHAGWSLVVVAHVFLLSSKIGAIKEAPQPLKKISVTLLAILGIQMTLGIVALGVVMMHPDRSDAAGIRLAIGATHQTFGAVLLGAVTLALAWIKRSLEPAPAG